MVTIPVPCLFWLLLVGGRNSIEAGLLVEKWSNFFPKAIFASSRVMKIQRPFPANVYMIKVNNRNSRKRCKTCSKLTIKTPE